MGLLSFFKKKDSQEVHDLRLVNNLGYQTVEEFVTDLGNSQELKTPAPAFLTLIESSSGYEKIKYFSDLILACNYFDKKKGIEGIKKHNAVHYLAHGFAHDIFKNYTKQIEEANSSITFNELLLEYFLPFNDVFDISKDESINQFHTKCCLVVVRTHFDNLLNETLSKYDYRVRVYGNILDRIELFQKEYNGIYSIERLPYSKQVLKEALIKMIKYCHPDDFTRLDALKILFLSLADFQEGVQDELFRTQSNSSRKNILDTISKLYPYPVEKKNEVHGLMKDFSSILEKREYYEEKASKEKKLLMQELEGLH